ncbi:MAG: DUF6580 family putative transport protein, partial [Planctomycetota bacterium]
PHGSAAFPTAPLRSPRLRCVPHGSAAFPTAPLRAAVVPAAGTRSLFTHHNMPFLLVLLVAASRFLPHPPNVACVAAMGLFLGAHCSGKLRYFAPLAAMLISDAAGQLLGVRGLGFYSPTIMIAVYLGMTLSVPIGQWIAARPGSQIPARPATRIAALWGWLRVPTASVVASTTFFIVSNLGVWLSPWYPLTAAGLVSCFVAAIPFYGYSLAADLLFSSVLFGAAALAAHSSRIQSLIENRSSSRFLSMARLSLDGKRSL